MDGQVEKHRRAAAGAVAFALLAVVYLTVAAVVLAGLTFSEMWAEGGD